MSLGPGLRWSGFCFNPPVFSKKTITFGKTIDFHRTCIGSEAWDRFLDLGKSTFTSQNPASFWKYQLIKTQNFSTNLIFTKVENFRIIRFSSKKLSKLETRFVQVDILNSKWPFLFPQRHVTKNIFIIKYITINIIYCIEIKTEHAE